MSVVKCVSYTQLYKPLSPCPIEILLSNRWIKYYLTYLSFQEKEKDSRNMLIYTVAEVCSSYVGALICQYSGLQTKAYKKGWKLWTPQRCGNNQNWHYSYHVVKGLKDLNQVIRDVAEVINKQTLRTSIRNVCQKVQCSFRNKHITLSLNNIICIR